MDTSHSPEQSCKEPRALLVRLDAESEAYLARAAELRRISVSNYIRTVVVAQAWREVLAADERTLALASDEQLAFWNALNVTTRLTEAQKQMSAMMRDESRIASSFSMDSGWRRQNA